MYPGIDFVNKLILFYGVRLPYHPGKWKLVESLLKLFHLQEYFGGRSFTVRRHNLLWKLYPDCLVQRALYYFSYYEVQETKWIQEQVRQNWVCFDVGSNFGYYAMLISHFSNRQAHVYAFEPLQRNYDLLNQNKSLNHLENLKTFKLALSANGGTVEFLIPPPGNLGHGRLANDYNKSTDDRGVELVQTATLDDFVRANQISRVDFIKVDIEGAEMMFLTGARETLQKLRPILMIECNPSALSEFGTSAAALLKTIHGLGYKTYRAGRSGLKAFNEVDAIEDYCNLICLP
jgi:FkbM family methyltransferase